MKNEAYIALALAAVLGAVLFASNLMAQDVVYCKHAQTGRVIAVQKGYACPRGYFRI